MGVYQVVAATVTFIRAGVYELPMQERFKISEELSVDFWETLVGQRCIGTGWIPPGSIEIITVSYTYAIRSGEAANRR